MQINHRGLDLAVSQKFFDGVNVIALIQQMGGKGMPKRMRGKTKSLQSAVFHCLVYGLLNRAIIEGESCLLPFKEIGFRTVLAVIGFHFFQKMLGQERKSVFVTFASHNFDLKTLAVYTFHF